MAVTVTALSGDAANARHISAVPFCTLVLCTNTQVRPAPATCVTVVLGVVVLSAEMNASSNSFPVEVENADVLTVFVAVVGFLEVVTSMPIAAHAVTVTIRVTVSVIKAAVKQPREVGAFIF